MTDPLLLALLFVAVASGWALGRRSSPAAREDSSPVPLPSQYYRGLNFLLDGRQEGAIDSFIRALEVNSETFDTHIALGNLLRRRGEVERAIRVHQNLLARPSLPTGQLHLAHLELARDYISAGLLDRAERLLLDLVEEEGDHQRLARRHLLEIYESQRDWSQARSIARTLLPRKSLLRGSSAAAEEPGQPVTVLMAHYCCEQAEVALAQGDIQAARTLVHDALQHDEKCVRASLLGGRLELKAERPAAALKALQHVREQEPDLIAETVPLLRETYVAMGKRQALRPYLAACFESRPSTTLVLAIAEEIRDTGGAEAAQVFLKESLLAKPSLRGLAMLMSLGTEHQNGNVETLELVTIRRLIEARSTYQCRHCGFKGQQMHWHCPGCKHWGTVRDMGTVGELIRG